MSTRQGADAGFTLLELLVAMTLLGLLMAAVLGGLRLGARAWEVTGLRLDQNARMQVVHDFLRARLAQAALPRRFDAPEDVAGSFVGEVDGLRFVTQLPEHLGSGFYVMQLGLAEDDGSTHLALRWRRFDLAPTGDGADQPDGWRARRLLEDVGALELAYFGARQQDAPRLWRERWDSVEALPELVRVRLAFVDGDRRVWPELIVRPMLDPSLLQDF